MASAVSSAFQYQPSDGEVFAPIPFGGGDLTAEEAGALLSQSVGAISSIAAAAIAQPQARRPGAAAAAAAPGPAIIPSQSRPVIGLGAFKPPGAKRPAAAMAAAPAAEPAQTRRPRLDAKSREADLLPPRVPGPRCKLRFSDEKQYYVLVTKDGFSPLGHIHSYCLVSSPSNTVGTPPNIVRIVATCSIGSLDRFVIDIANSDTASLAQQISEFSGAPLIEQNFYDPLLPTEQERYSFAERYRYFRLEEGKFYVAKLGDPVSFEEMRITPVAYVAQQAAIAAQRQTGLPMPGGNLLTGAIAAATQAR